MTVKMISTMKMTNGNKKGGKEMSNITFNKRQRKLYKGNVAAKGIILLDRLAQSDSIEALTEYLKGLAKSAVQGTNDRAAFMIWDRSGNIVSHENL